MGFFTTRERAELGKSVDLEVEGKVRELVRRDFAPMRRPPDSNIVANNVGSLLQRVTGTSLNEIDNLIAELQAQREKLLSESERVQRDIIEFAKLSQQTMQSTKIITESLAYWNKIPEQAGHGELHVDDASRKQRSRTRAEAYTRSEDHNGMLGRQADPAAAADSSGSETNPDQEDPGPEMPVIARRE
jgi:hypothetical protein